MEKLKSKGQRAKSIAFLMLFFLIFSFNSLAQFNIAEQDTISNADSVATYDLQDYKLAGIILPATVTATTFTLLTADVDTAYSGYKVVQYDGSDVTITASDGKYCMIKPVQSNGLLRYVMIRGNVKEAAKRTFYWVKTRF